MTLMVYKNVKAKIEYVSDIDMFRGEILGLTGSADFYGTNVKKLKSEFKKSLCVYLEECEKSGQEPYRNYSGKFVLRMPEDLHIKDYQ